MSIEPIYKVTLHPFINESIASLKSMTSLTGSSSETFMDKLKISVLKVTPFVQI